MSLETVSERRRKRIAEYRINSFSSAQEAVAFSNLVMDIIKTKVGTVKTQRSIGSPATKLAITMAWHGPTVLKLEFLEIDQNQAVFISELMGKFHNHNIEHANIREKPQVQKIEVARIPSTLKVNQIG